MISGVFFPAIGSIPNRRWVTFFPALTTMNRIIFVAVMLSLFFALAMAGCAVTAKEPFSADGRRVESDHRPAETRQKFKIVHIMSYHSPWEWTDTQFDGFKEALKDIDVEYKVFMLDAKNKSSREWLRQSGREARELIASWRPDLVYASDDEAQEYVTKHYLGSDIPLVFSGVNLSPQEYGFSQKLNVTGVLEVEHFVESAALFHRSCREPLKWPLFSTMRRFGRRWRRE